jgi:hypothetical protein
MDDDARHRTGARRPGHGREVSRGRATRGMALAGAIAILPSPAGPGAGQPSFVNTPFSGEVALSWMEPRPGDSGHRLRWSRLDDRDRWSPPETIAEGDSFFVNWADFPAVSHSLGTSNRAGAHWLWKVGAGTYAYQVRTSIAQGRLDKSTIGRWSGPIIPHRDTTATEHGFVSMVPEAGGFRAVWLDGRNTGGEPPGAMTLRTAVIEAGGTLTDERELDDRVCDCCATAMTRAKDGTTVVAYRDRSEEEVRDIAVVRRVNGKWATPVTIPGDGWKFAACPVNGPALAASGDRVVLAWFTAARDSPVVKVAVSGDGGATFGPAMRLSEEPAVGRVDLAAFGGGGVVVSWMERIGDEGRAAIVHRILDPGGTWRPRRMVQEVSSARASGVPQVVVERDRRVVFAWTEAGTPSRIRLAAYAIED